MSKILEFKEKAKVWIKDPYNLVLVGILAFALAIRLYFFFVTKTQPLWWDEAEYMLKAKNLAFGTPETGWFSGRPILFSLVSALFFKIGLGQAAIRFVLILFSTGGVLLTYLIGKEMFNKKVGLVAAFIMACFYIDLFYTSRLLVDMPQVFFVLLATFLFVKYYFGDGNKNLVYWIIPVLLVGSLVRFTVGISLIVLLVFLLFSESTKLFKKKEWYFSIGIAALLYIPYGIYSWIKYNNPFGVILNVLVGSTGDRAAGVTAFDVFMQYIKYSPHYINIVIYIVFLLGLLFVTGNLVLRFDKIKESKDAQKYFLLLLMIVVPLIYFGFFVNHFEDRYIFMIFPAVFVIIGLSFNKILDFSKIFIKNSKTLVIVVLILLLIFSGYTMVKQSNLLIKSKINGYEGITYAGNWIKSNSNRTDIVFSSSIPQNAYYSERATYGYPHNESEFPILVMEKKPKYMVLSTIERSQDWVYTWPDNNKEKIKPVQAYFTDSTKKEVSTIIYEFVY